MSDLDVETTIRSTEDWRAWWIDQAIIDGTDWITLLDVAGAMLTQLYEQHGGESSDMSACSICDGPEPCRNSFCGACRDADARKARSEFPRYIEPSRWRKPDNIPDNWEQMSIEALMAHFDRARRRDGASQATVEALMLELRERGVRALSESAVQRRLSQLSNQQVMEVGNRLQRLKPEIARAWSATEVQILFKARIAK